MPITRHQTGRARGGGPDDGLVEARPPGGPWGDAAARTASAQGVGRSRPARSASRRVARSTPARAAGVGGGNDERPRTERRSASETLTSRPSRRSLRSGSGAQTVNPPGERPPRARGGLHPVVAFDRVHHGGHPALRASASSSSLRAAASTSGSPVGDVRRERAGRGPHVTGETGAGHGAARHGVREALGQLVDPGPVATEVASTVARGTPSRSMSRTRSARHCSTSAGVSRSAWLSTTIVDGLVGGQRRDVVVVEACVGVLLGSVTHTKRSTSSSTRSASTRWSSSRESKSGRSSRTSPSSDPTCAASEGFDVAARAHGEPVEESATGSSPHTAATGVEVVGRRTPTAATGAPTRALNSDDLPLPVAPASATTVAADERGALLHLLDHGAGAGRLGRRQLPAAGLDRRPEGRRRRREPFGRHDGAARGAHAQRAHRTTVRRPAATAASRWA